MWKNLEGTDHRGRDQGEQIQMNGQTIRFSVQLPRRPGKLVAMHSHSRNMKINGRYKTDSEGNTSGERGMALIGVMLVMSLMVMLALAVTFTALSDHSVTSNFRNGASGFYAAEAGINNVHRLIHGDQIALKSIPNPPHVTPGQPTLTPDS